MGTKSYGYNALNRDTSGPIAGTTGSTAYTYSAGGNMTQATNLFTTAKYHQLGELCWTLNRSLSNSCATTTYTWLKRQRVWHRNSPSANARSRL